MILWDLSFDFITKTNFEHHTNLYLPVAIKTFPLLINFTEINSKNQCQIHLIKQLVRLNQIGNFKNEFLRAMDIWIISIAILAELDIHNFKGVDLFALQSYRYILTWNLMMFHSFH